MSDKHNVFNAIDRRGQILLESLHKHCATFFKMSREQTELALAELIAEGVVRKSAPRGATGKVLVYFSREKKRIAFRAQNERV